MDRVQYDFDGRLCASTFYLPGFKKSEISFILKQDVIEIFASSAVKSIKHRVLLPAEMAEFHVEIMDNKAVLHCTKGLF